MRAIVSRRQAIEERLRLGAVGADLGDQAATSGKVCSARSRSTNESRSSRPYRSSSSPKTWVSIVAAPPVSKVGRTPMLVMARWTVRPMVTAVA